MKKILLLTLLLVLGCAKDIDYEIVDFTFVPDELVIAEDAGLRLASNIVHGNVDINVKLPSAGTYRIRVLDITNRIISQEKIQALQGFRRRRYLPLDAPHVTLGQLPSHQ